jgi:hypothetical protein
MIANDKKQSLRLSTYVTALVPESSYPDDNRVVFLPAQAAADDDIYERAMESIELKVTTIKLSIPFRPKLLITSL